MTYQGPWNLLPRHGQKIPWTCSLHGQVNEVMCAACRTEYEAYKAQWPSFTCPRCGMTSWNSTDVEHCPFC